MIRSSSTPSSGGSGKRSVLFRTTTCGSCVEPLAVRRQLAVDRGPALGGLAVRGVDHVHEQPGALQVREELVAEPDALARALDQPGNVRDGQLPPVGRVDRAENRRERRERVLRDLRPRVRDSRQERRLARIREPDERRVGHQLQPQLELGLLAGQADLGEARRLPRRGREALVAPPPGPAAPEDHARARAREVGDELVVLVDLRPGGHAQLDALARGAVLPRASAGLAALRLDPLAPLQSRQVAEIRVGDNDDVPAGTAVAAVGPALGTCFSRRKLIAPSPPRPAFTRMRARSWNTALTPSR